MKQTMGRSGADLTVRLASAEDLPVVATVLARAFFCDPVFSWLMPDSRHRIWQLTAYFCAVFPLYEAYLTTNRGSAALWNPPRTGESHNIELLRQLFFTLRIEGRYIGRLVRVARLLESHRPKEPHWYLHAVGTLPEAREPFLGGVVVRALLNKADGRRQPVYLENTNPRNRPFYTHFGFEPLPELVLPGERVLLPMWRAPCAATDMGRVS